MFPKFKFILQKCLAGQKFMVAVQGRLTPFPST